MELFRNRVVWYPLLFAAGLFLADKIFYLGPVRDRTLHYQKSEPDFYDSRHTLFHLMGQQARSGDGRRIALILGSSRSGSFAPEDINAYMPATVPYNYSVPMGGMVHSWYWAERAVRAGIRPSLLLVEADIANFSEGSLAFMLQYDFDPAFVLRNTSLFAPAVAHDSHRGFTIDEADTWFLKYLFATYRYPVDLKSIRENYRPVPGAKGHIFLEARYATRDVLELSLREHAGAIPNPVKVEASEEFLEKDARYMGTRIFSGQSSSRTQYYFFERLLDLAVREGIPLILHKPVVSYPFARVIEQNAPEFQDHLQRTLQQKREEVKAMTGREPALFYVDPEASGRLKCRAFVDALHLGGKCFAELTERIFRPVPIR